MVGPTLTSPAGRLMVEEGFEPDVLHTSVLLRAIRTADLALAEAGWTDMPTHRSWRLNERHYGALQGLNKKETAERYGAEQVLAWRRSYDVRPPALELTDPRHPTSSATSYRPPNAWQTWWIECFLTGTRRSFRSCVMVRHPWSWPMGTH